MCLVYNIGEKMQSILQNNLFSPKQSQISKTQSVCLIMFCRYRLYNTHAADLEFSSGCDLLKNS